VSGTGTDSSNAAAHVARVKGETENALLKVPFKAAYMFVRDHQPPRRGPKTKWLRSVYAVIGRSTLS